MTVEPRATAAGTPALLELRGVTCRYAGGDAPALTDVDLAVAPGELVVVLGHTGAGKSTLLKCLTGIVPGFERAELTGERRAFGASLDGVRPGDLAGRIGIVFQDFEAQLFSTNVALEVGFAPQQLGLPREEIVARTARALDRVGLGGFAARDPATLSGGEKQRLAIAGVLALEPEVVLLDEPTTDIDPRGKRRVLALLRELRDAGVGVVLVEHEILATAGADRVVLMSSGRVLAAGAADELCRDVALLEASGVRPRDLDVIAHRLGLDTRWSDVDDAERDLRARGLLPRDGALVTGSSPSVVPAPNVPATAPGAAPLLEVRDVHFSYTDGVPALGGVSLRIAAGEYVALIGQNGSGKTTLAKHLNGLLTPTAGRVLLGGEDVHRLGLGAVARRVGFVFQDPDHQLFCATVEEEVAYGTRHLGVSAVEAAAHVTRALDVCGLGGRRREDPFLLGKGERQRLAVAAILALEPQVLILDEPTTGLDHREQLAILDLLRDLNRVGRTVIVITHAPWLVAEHASRAILMARGRVVLDGDVHALFGAGDALQEASFVLPDATALGLRLGVSVRSAAELVERLSPRRSAP